MLVLLLLLLLLLLLAQGWLLGPAGHWRCWEGLTRPACLDSTGASVSTHQSMVAKQLRDWPQHEPLQAQCTCGGGARPTEPSPELLSLERKPPPPASLRFTLTCSNSTGVNGRHGQPAHVDVWLF